jgi:hypothetical protein
MPLVRKMRPGDLVEILDAATGAILWSDRYWGLERGWKVDLIPGVTVLGKAKNGLCFLADPAFRIRCTPAVQKEAR